MGFKFNPFTGNFDQTGSGGGGATVFDGEVQFFSDLPQTVGTPPVNSAYLVRESEGTIWFGNKKQKGIYIRSGNSGVRNDDWTYGGEYPVTSVNGQTGAVTVAAATHAAAHASAGSDPLAPRDIGAQSLFTSSSQVVSADVTLTSGRATKWTIENYNGTNYNITLPTSNNQAGDVIVVVTGTLVGSQTIRKLNFGSNYTTLATLSDGQSYRFIATASGGGSWQIDPVYTHEHNASAITSGTLDIARIPTGTGSTQVALGDHTHELTALAATGATNGHVLTANGSGGVTFAAASGGDTVSIDSTAADILSATSGAISADDAGADRMVFWDDSASKLTYLEAGSGLSISGTTLSATATGTIGGSTGSTDNSLLRSDGTGGSTAQASALVVDDAVVTFSTITGDAGTDIITATGSAFSNGQRVRFTALTGGSGLNTTTNYFVINASGATFQVSTSQGGSASLFTTNITNGTLLTGHAVSTCVSILNNSSETNSALVLGSKGSGALLASVPDGTSAGGNGRGTNAVDLQRIRSLNTSVASGNSSVIVGGENNRADGLNSVVAGGKGNRSQGAGSCVLGGENNVPSGEFSAVCGGYGNAASGQSSFVGGGGYWSPSLIANTASATFSSVLGGQAAIADRYGIQAHANGRFAANADAQRFRAVLRCKTTTNSAVEMALDGSTTYLTIPSGKVIFCNIKVVGVKSDGSVVATYERQYAAKNVAGTSSEIFAEVTIGTDNASSTSLDISTVDAGDYISIKPTGIASETWRWVASVDAVEVAYGT